jgi:hypothetical protein
MKQDQAPFLSHSAAYGSLHRISGCGLVERALNGNSSSNDDVSIENDNNRT